MSTHRNGSSPRSARHVVSIALLLALPAAALAPAALAHDTINFQKDVKPILQRSCGGESCHINEKTSGVELTSYTTLFTSVGIQYESPIVVPGNPDLSPLYDKISNATPRIGDRMPLGAAPLEDAEIALIRRWIAEGAADRHLPFHGDADGDDTLSITDAVYLLNFLFSGGPAPACDALADGNSDGAVNLSDAVFVLLYLFSGGPSPAELTEHEEEACRVAGELSFASIYEKVFAASCAFSSCHSDETRKGGLSFADIDTAHAALVGVASMNEVAAAAGWPRVDPGRPDTSFLLKKLGEPGPGEGNRMPASARDPLPPEFVTAIREWIFAGAPRDGTVAGVPDIGDLPPITLGELAQPPVPENGIQLHVPPFAIAPRTEREIFFYVDKPLAALGVDEVIVQRIDVHMLENSHHFIIYEFVGPNKPPPGARPVANVSDLVSTRKFIVGSQQSFFSQSFPEGVGLRMSKDASFDLNSHYLNLDGTQTLRGEVYINLFFAAPGSVTTFAKPIFEINPNINVPPNQTRTTEWLFPGPTSLQADPALGTLANVGAVPREVHIYSLGSHMHRHGDRFSAFLIQSGRDVDPPMRLYDNFDWDDPVYTVFEPPFILRQGQGMRFTTTHTYDDPPSPGAPPLTFGITSEDEMAILLGYYAVK